jgi:hypothetical protein
MPPSPGGPGFFLGINVQILQHQGLTIGIKWIDQRLVPSPAQFQLFDFFAAFPEVTFVTAALLGAAVFAGIDTAATAFSVPNDFPSSRMRARRASSAFAACRGEPCLQFELTYLIIIFFETALRISGHIRF